MAACHRNAAGPSARGYSEAFSDHEDAENPAKCSVLKSSVGSKERSPFPRPCKGRHRVHHRSSPRTIGGAEASVRSSRGSVVGQGTCSGEKGESCASLGARRPVVGRPPPTPHWATARVDRGQHSEHGGLPRQPPRQLGGDSDTRRPEMVVGIEAVGCGLPLAVVAVIVAGGFILGTARSRCQDRPPQDVGGDARSPSCTSGGLSCRGPSRTTRSGRFGTQRLDPKIDPGTLGVEGCRRFHWARARRLGYAWRGLPPKDRHPKRARCHEGPC